MSPRVLVATGSFVSPADGSLLEAARKLWIQWRHSEAAWLDLKVKCVGAEPIVAAALERLRLSSYEAGLRRTVLDYLGRRETFDTPELTEVVLATLLNKHGIEYRLATYSQLFADAGLRERLLAETDCVFASTTLLRDLSEVEPVVELLKRPHNKMVLGGALTGTLAPSWPGMEGVDVLAAGYGELLAEPLARWVKGGFESLEAPPGGRLEARGGMTVLRSGVPEGKDLDFLDLPDWGLSAKDHGRRYRLVHYESVRGCPFRCAFCNYPFLFDDTRFRYKSAERIASDWRRYVDELGVEYISCLDSLFTVPRRRLIELCGRLVRERTQVGWVCYARADDLAVEETAWMMKEAGCVQVHIGLESGDQGILDNMNKRCTVENNAQAVANCRKAGITTAVSLIVGFPGETPSTLEATYRHMEEARPDFHFLATFSTRVADVPVLAEDSRRRFGLAAVSNLRSVAPYWEHATMSCAEVGGYVRALGRRLAENKVSLDAAVFYGGILSYRPELRAPLLEFQARAAARRGMRRAFDAANSWIDRRLAADSALWLAPELARLKA